MPSLMSDSDRENASIVAVYRNDYCLLVDVFPCPEYLRTMKRREAEYALLARTFVPLPSDSIESLLKAQFDVGKAESSFPPGFPDALRNITKAICGYSSSEALKNIYLTCVTKLPDSPLPRTTISALNRRDE